MLWRKLRLDWSYAAGELLIVVVGVLIALAIDQWNDNRLERIEEAEAISRILADVKIDLQSFEFRLNHIEQKEASLLRLRSAFAKTPTDDLAAFLRDIIVGADFGWNQGMASSATFDDLLGAGKLGIINDPDIRFEIADYYRYFLDSHIRIDERETAYPALSYQLVPRPSPAFESDENIWEHDVEHGLSDEQLRKLVAEVFDSPIRNHVTAEINLARFIRRITVDIQGRAEDLAAQLDEYGKAPQ